MVTIRNEEKKYIIKCVKDGEIAYVYLLDLIGRLWNDYVDRKIDNVNTRGILKDLQFTDVEIFRMLEQLQVGRAEFEESDDREVSYR